MELIKLNNRVLTLSFNEAWKFSGFKEVQDQYDKNLMKWSSMLTYDTVRAKPYDILCSDSEVKVLTGPFLYSQTRALQDVMVQIYGTELFHQLREKTYNSISLTVAVISSDSKLLVGLRSQGVHTYKNYWAVGIAEGLEAKDFQAKDIVYAIKRGLIEEINIELESHIPRKNLCIIKDEDKFSTSLFSLVDFRHMGEQYSSVNILEKARSAQDAWEHEKLVFIEPDFQAFIKVAENKKLIAYTKEFIELVQDYLEESKKK